MKDVQGSEEVSVLYVVVVCKMHTAICLDGYAFIFMLW